MLHANAAPIKSSNQSNNQEEPRGVGMNGLLDPCAVCHAPALGDVREPVIAPRAEPQ
jgi:hypothetical protein